MTDQFELKQQPLFDRGRGAVPKGTCDIWLLKC